MNAINHEWIRELVSACTAGNSHGNDVSDQVLCHRMAFQINKHFGLETWQYNTDGDPERDKDFKDPYPSGSYVEELQVRNNERIAQGEK
jgi:hypothetical protein